MRISKGWLTMRNIKKWLPYFCVIALLAIILPFPKQIEKTMKGTIYTQTGETIEDVTIQINGCHFCFLFFEDRYTYIVTISTETETQTFQIRFSKQYDVSDSWKMFSFGPIYEAKQNGYVSGGYLLLSEDLSKICIKDSEVYGFQKSIVIESKPDLVYIQHPFP